VRSETAGCVLCLKHRGEYAVPGGAIYAGELVYAGHAHLTEGGSIQYLGWVTVETRRHIPGLAGLSDAEARGVGLLAMQLSCAIQDVTRAEHIYSFVLGRLAYKALKTHSVQTGAGS